MKPGILYIVATPIGHLGDMTARAIETLRAVDIIAAEDTRHSQPLLRHFGIQKPLVSLHEHNEREKSIDLIEEIKQGKNLALISDAGTPLISDPGYHLVRLATRADLQVVPIPGPSALIAALSVSGLPTDRFQFEGFLSAKASERRRQLEDLVNANRTLVFYESPHRIIATLTDMLTVFGSVREAVIARELTKAFETVQHGNLERLLRFVEDSPNQQRGEFVILIAGMPEKPSHPGLSLEAERVLKILLSALSHKEAVSLAAKITGVRKQILYDYALSLK